MIVASRRRRPLWDEGARVAALARYDLFDTPPETEFDELAELASEICETPIAIVNLVGRDRQWFKAEVGLGVQETPLESSFCGHAILEQDFMQVPDATLDPRFAGNPLITQAPHLRFYAGALLKSPDGYPVGTVCVLDYKARALTDLQAKTLRRLAQQVMARMELRRVLRELNDVNASLAARVAERTQERDRIWQVSQDLLGTADTAGIWRSVNPAWTRVLGWDAADLVGRTSEWMEHPDDRARTRAEVERLAANETTVDFENRMRTRDGRYRTLSWRAVPTDGVLYCVGRDVTDLRTLEQQFRQSQKMEAVGQLTGGIAHDFNNLLTGIQGSLELLQSRVAQGRFKDLGRYITAAQGAGQRAAALTHRLLAFSRQQPLEPQPTDVNRLIAGMTDMVRRTVGPSVTLHVSGNPALWATLVDPNQLENALLNLCINARDAMPGGGRLRIETANQHVPPDPAPPGLPVGGPMGTPVGAPVGDCVAVSVIDTGTGMTPDVLARAFDPFFTTKPTGQGTGLGLSMIYGFARQSSGAARITSEPGQGTTVCLLLPRHHGPVDAAADDVTSVASIPRAGPGETVLVVDDDPTVRLVVADLLGDMGYTPIDVADADAALVLLRSDMRVDLLITDVGLEGQVGGRQLADLARHHRPTLKVLFVTGLVEDPSLRQEQLAAGMDVLNKPFTLPALASRIHRITTKA